MKQIEREREREREKNICHILEQVLDNSFICQSLSLILFLFLLFLLIRREKNKVALEVVIY